MWVFLPASTLVPTQPRAPLLPVVARLISSEIVSAIATSTESTRACAARFRVAQSTVVRIRKGQLRTDAAQRPWIRISDAAVEEMRVRHEESGWTLTMIVNHYRLPKSTVCAILKYRRR